MIKKLFVLSVLTTLAVCATSMEKSTTNVETKEQSRGWNLDDVKKESEESCETGNCDNGNCPTNFKCFQKDGPMHSFMSMFTDRMKRHCNRD